MNHLRSALPKGDKHGKAGADPRRLRTLMLLQSFQNFIRAHPELRFHQAFRSWMGVDRVEVTPSGSTTRLDTYYFEGKDK